MQAMRGGNPAASLNDYARDSSYVVMLVQRCHLLFFGPAVLCAQNGASFHANTCLQINMQLGQHCYAPASAQGANMTASDDPNTTNLYVGNISSQASSRSPFLLLACVHQGAAL